MGSSTTGSSAAEHRLEGARRRALGVGPEGDARSRRCPPRAARSGSASTPTQASKARVEGRLDRRGLDRPGAGAGARRASAARVSVGVGQPLEAGQDMPVQRLLGDRGVVGRRGRRRWRRGREGRRACAFITATPGSGSEPRDRPWASAPTLSRAACASPPCQRIASSRLRARPSCRKLVWPVTVLGQPDAPERRACAIRSPVARPSGRWSASPSPMSCSRRSV